jgi:hypothetical protein
MQPGASRSCKRRAAEAALENIRNIRRAQTAANNNARSRSNNAIPAPVTSASDLTHYNAMQSNLTDILISLTCINNEVDNLIALYNSVESQLEDEVNTDPNPEKAKKTQELVIKGKKSFIALTKSKRSSIGKTLKIYYVALSLAEARAPPMSNARVINRWLSTLSTNVATGSNTLITIIVKQAVDVLIAQARRTMRVHKKVLMTYLEKNKTPVIIDLTQEDYSKKTQELIDLTKDVENVVRVENDAINVVETELNKISLEADPMDVLVDQLGKLDIRIGGRRQQRYRKQT